MKQAITERAVADPKVREALARNIDPKNWPEPPGADVIARARERAGMTVEQAAAVVWRSRESWAKWESASAIRSRDMDPVLWAWFCLCVAVARGWPLEWATMTDRAFNHVR